MHHGGSYEAENQPRLDVSHYRSTCICADQSIDRRGFKGVFYDKDLWFRENVAPSVYVLRVSLVQEWVQTGVRLRFTKRVSGGLPIG